MAEPGDATMQLVAAVGLLSLAAVLARAGSARIGVPALASYLLLGILMRVAGEPRELL